MSDIVDDVAKLEEMRKELLSNWRHFDILNRPPVAAAFAVVAKTLHEMKTSDHFIEEDLKEKFRVRDAKVLASGDEPESSRPLWHIPSLDV